jgi:hypothetical protein
VTAKDGRCPSMIGRLELVARVPEAVVKVLPKDSNSLASVSRHVGYIGRYGDLELETDDGDRLSGKGIGRQLLEDWDLDLDEHRRQSDLAAALGRKPPKLVHKLMFSMPPGTPADGLLAATSNFLREEFALKHRYAFVLHTDEPHPHVHAVVKAVSANKGRGSTFVRALCGNGGESSPAICASRESRPMPRSEPSEGSIGYRKSTGSTVQIVAVRRRICVGVLGRCR